MHSGKLLIQFSSVGNHRDESSIILPTVETIAIAKVWYFLPFLVLSNNNICKHVQLARFLFVSIRY